MYFFKTCSPKITVVTILYVQLVLQKETRGWASCVTPSVPWNEPGHFSQNWDPTKIPGTLSCFSLVWAPTTLQLKPTELVSGQARGNLLTNEFLLLQTTSTALPRLLKAHDRINHLHPQECSWRLDFHDCWVFNEAPISCSRSCECSALPKQQFDEGRQGPHPGSGRRLQMQSVSFRFPVWGASASKCSGKPIPKCGHGPWAGTGKGCCKKSLIPVPALVPAVQGSQEWAEHARSRCCGVSLITAFACTSPQHNCSNKLMCLWGLDLLKLHRSRNFRPKFNWQEEDLIDICFQLESALEREQILQSNSPASPTVPPLI